MMWHKMQYIISEVAKAMPNPLSTKAQALLLTTNASGTKSIKPISTMMGIPKFILREILT